MMMMMMSVWSVTSLQHVAAIPRHVCQTGVCTVSWNKLPWLFRERCATASPTNCSQFRTLSPGSWRASGRRCDHNRLCSASFTGFLCCSASCSRLRLSSTSPCLATPRVTWPTTVSSSPTPVSDECVLSVECAAFLKTGPLPPQDHTSGTVCRPISDDVGCHTASTRGCWRQRLESEATAQYELFNCAE